MKQQQKRTFAAHYFHEKQTTQKRWFNIVCVLGWVTNCYFIIFAFSATARLICVFLINKRSIAYDVWHILTQSALWYDSLNLVPSKNMKQFRSWVFFLRDLVFFNFFFIDLICFCIRIECILDWSLRLQRVVISFYEKQSLSLCAVYTPTPSPTPIPKETGSMLNIPNTCGHAYPNKKPLSDR